MKRFVKCFVIAVLVIMALSLAGVSYADSYNVPTASEYTDAPLLETEHYAEPLNIYIPWDLNSNYQWVRLNAPTDGTYSFTYRQTYGYASVAFYVYSEMAGSDPVISVNSISGRNQTSAYETKAGDILYFVTVAGMPTGTNIELIVCFDGYHEARDSAWTLSTPTCTEPGRRASQVCKHCGTVLSVVESPALGHDWGSANYTWSSDNKIVIASHTCLRDPEHRESVKVNTRYQVEKEATTSEDGKATYIAQFENEGFETQRKSVTLPKLISEITKDNVIYRLSGDNALAIGVKDKNAKSVNIAEAIEVSGKKYGVTEITKGAFKKMPNLKTVSIGKNVQKIGKEAFYGCPKLESVSGGYHVGGIGEGAFQYCTSLKKFTSQSRVKTIEANAFNGCTAMTEVKFEGKSLKTIGEKAFYNCSKLSKVTGGWYIKTIGNYAFQNCTALKEITIQSRVESIGTKAFFNCKALKKVTFAGNSLKSIGAEAFGKVNKNITFVCPEKKMDAYKKLIKNADAPKDASFATVSTPVEIEIDF